MPMLSISSQENKKHTLLHLSLIPNIGPATVLKILSYLHHEAQPDFLHVSWMDVINQQDAIDFSAVYSYTPYDFIKKIGCGERIASQLVQGLADKSVLEKELSLKEMHNINITTIFDRDYPEILKQIHAPPLILYTQGGSFNQISKCMGIVGSRKASDYAAHAVKNIVPGLVEHGWCIVSGGAQGADTMAHEAALAASGKTIAVIGSGLLQPYPESNRLLFKRMAESGSIVVSSFPLLAPPEKGNFPSRNRIIAGLSQGCIVVQAAEKSGALITARYALEQGRQIFAVPGLIYDSLSAGCHSLIKQGAKLVNHVNDILEEFGEVHKMVSVQPALRAGATSFLFPETNNSSTNEIKFQAAERDEHPILMYLVQPATLDELLEQTGLDIMELQNQLFSLQLEGKVRQNFVGTWERV